MVPIWVAIQNWSSQPMSHLTHLSQEYLNLRHDLIPLTSSSCVWMYWNFTQGLCWPEGIISCSLPQPKLQFTAGEEDTNVNDYVRLINIQLRSDWNITWLFHKAFWKPILEQTTPMYLLPKIFCWDALVLLYWVEHKALVLTLCIGSKWPRTPTEGAQQDLRHVFSCF